MRESRSQGSVRGALSNGRPYRDTPSFEDAERIKVAYRRAWRHVGSPVKMRSVTEQLEFYEDIFSDGAPETATRRKSLAAWFAELRNFVESEFPGVKAAG